MHDVQLLQLPARWVWRVQSFAPEPHTSLSERFFAGRRMPTEVGVVLEDAGTRLLCIAPSDWLVIGSGGAPEQVERGGAGLLVTAIGAGLVTFELQGSAARDLLARGCGIDTHPRAFVPGRFVRTRFAQCAVLIECRGSPERFELSVARSYASYLGSWLTDAAFGSDTPERPLAAGF